MGKGLGILAAGLLAASVASAQVPRERAEVFVQLGHRSAVTAVAFSPDGQRLASAGLDGAIKLWDVHSGRVAATLTGHAGSILGLAWTPDGARLASAGRDRTLRTWDARSGAALGVHRGHDNIVLAVVFLPDSQHFVSAGYDGTVRLWRIGQPEPTAEIGRHGEPVRALALSADGRLLASAGEDRRIRHWDLVRRSLDGEPASLPSGALSVAISTAGELAAGLQDGSIRLWRPAERATAPRELRGHKGPVNALAWSPDGRFLASASGDGTVHLWEAASGRALATRGGGGEQNAIAFSPRGSLVAAGGLDHAVRLWSVPEVEAREMLRSRTTEVRGADFSADGAALAIAGSDGTVRVWDAARGQVARALAAGAPVEVVRFSADGARIAAGGQDGAVHLWERASGRALARFPAHKGAAFAVALSPDGAMLASGGRDGAVRLWSASGAPLRELKGHGAAVRDLAFSPDGRRLASASNDDTVRLWEVATGREAALLKGHSNRVNAVRFSGDGTRVVSAGEDSVLRVWDAASGAQLAVLAGHKGPIKALAVHGATAFSASADETVAVWDLAGKLVRRASPGAGQLFAVAVSPRGLLAAAGDGGVAVIADIASLAERVRFFGFTDGEWLSIVPDGQFHASPNGARYLNVKVGERIYGLDQFLETFLRPDVVMAALRGEAPADTMIAERVRLERELAEKARLEKERAAKELAERARAEKERLEREIAQKELLEKERAARELAERQRLERERLEKELAEKARIEKERLQRELAEKGRLENERLEKERIERERIAAIKPPPAAPRVRQLADVKPAPEVVMAGLPAETAAAEVNVRLRITDRGGGVGDVRLYLNGAAVVQDRSADRASRAGERDYLVRLAEGRNVIRAVAFNADNTMQSADALHELTARPAGRRRPQLHALVIGIQEYVNPRLRLSYSVADANLFAATLESRAAGLFEQVRIRRLLTAAETTRTSIAAAIAELRARIEPDDLFVFYVASHGTVDEGEYFLLTSNVGSTATERLRSDALGERDLRDLLANVPATKKLIVLDTCNAGRLGDVLQAAVLTRGMEEDRAAKVLSRAVGSTVLSAATSLQEAIEGYNGHGLFTYVVAEALAGKADFDRDGYVKTTELALYVDNEVPELAERVFRYKQFPIVSPTGMGFPVTRASQPGGSQ